jgi:dienelactone hydrolase
LNIGVAKLINQNKWTRKEFVVVTIQYPEASPMAYHATLKKFIDQICEKLNIDPANVYLLGISGGANTVFNYIVQPYPVKAAIAISGAGSARKAKDATHVRLWAIHGEEDTKIYAADDKKFIDAYNAASPYKPALFTLIPFHGHDGNVWDKACASRKLYEWMLVK